MNDAEPTPEALAKSPETGSEDSIVRTLHARRRTPAFAFLLGAIGIALVGALLYFLLATRAETPATPVEGAVTDEIDGLPVPDGRAITAQVDAALRASPRDPNQPAEQAAAEALARTRPEPDDTPAAVEAPTAAQAEAAVDRAEARTVEAR